MKKLGSLVILALVSGLTLANEVTETNNLTLAAVDTASSPSWALEAARPTSEKRLNEALEEKTLELTEKINAQLEKSLEEKLNREIVF